MHASEDGEGATPRSGTSVEDVGVGVGVGVGVQML